MNLYPIADTEGNKSNDSESHLVHSLSCESISNACEIDHIRFLHVNLFPLRLYAYCEYIEEYGNLARGEGHFQSLLGIFIIKNFIEV